MTTANNIATFLSWHAQVIDTALLSLHENAGIPPQEVSEMEIATEYPGVYSILADTHFVVLDSHLQEFGYCNLAAIDEHFAVPHFGEE